ncbi:hypothetical protein TNCV_4506721, partial [Trichonephila clavipes]
TRKRQKSSRRVTGSNGEQCELLGDFTRAFRRSQLVKRSVGVPGRSSGREDVLAFHRIRLISGHVPCSLFQKSVNQSGDENLMDVAYPLSLKELWGDWPSASKIKMERVETRRARKSTERKDDATVLEKRVSRRICFFRKRAFRVSLFICVGTSRDFGDGCSLNSPL